MKPSLFSSGFLKGEVRVWTTAGRPGIESGWSCRVASAQDVGSRLERVAVRATVRE